MNESEITDSMKLSLRRESSLLETRASEENEQTDRKKRRPSIPLSHASAGTLLDSTRLLLRLLLVMVEEGDSLLPIEHRLFNRLGSDHSTRDCSKDGKLLKRGSIHLTHLSHLYLISLRISENLDACG